MLGLLKIQDISFGACSDDRDRKSRNIVRSVQALERRGGTPVVAPNGIPTAPLAVDRLSSNTNGVIATSTVIPPIFRLKLLFFQFLKKRPGPTRMVLVLWNLSFFQAILSHYKKQKCSLFFLHRDRCDSLLEMISSHTSFRSSICPIVTKVTEAYWKFQWILRRDPSGMEELSCWLPLNVFLKGCSLRWDVLFSPQAACDVSTWDLVSPRQTAWDQHWEKNLKCVPVVVWYRPG